MPFAKNGKAPRSINTVHLPKGKDYNIASKGKLITIAEDNKYGNDTESISSGMLQSLMNRCFYRSQNLTPTESLRPAKHMACINRRCSVVKSKALYKRAKPFTIIVKGFALYKCGPHFRLDHEIS